MNFKVPGAVLNRISQYDPAQPKAKKSRNTLGLVNDLFPADIVPVETQNEWAIEMNKRDSGSDRVLKLDSSTSNAVLIVDGTIWVALWHTKPGHPEHGKYVFGLSVAYRCSPSYLKRFKEHKSPMVTKTLTLQSILPCTEVQYGRTLMRKHTGLVTASDIVEWDLNDIPTGIGTDWWPLREVYTEFRKTLSHVIPCWYWKGVQKCFTYFDFGFFFKRLQLEHAPIRAFRIVLTTRDYSPRRKELDWGLRGDLKDDIKVLISSLFPNISKIMSTPYFKRNTLEVASQIKSILSEENSIELDIDTCSLQYLDSCKFLSDFISIYGGGASLDYCQRIWKSSKMVSIRLPYSCGNAFDWIRNNVPVSSFVNMVERSDHGRKMRDTVEMMETLSVTNNLTSLPKPTRWRIDELHDLVNEELFKVKNPNKSLPQDLFPEPIKVDNLTFFQPKDTHQLSKWGKSVRNCVGNSTRYASRVSKKKEFIVLALEDGKPHLTIQLYVEEGMMSVKHIVKESNRGLTPQESKDYAKKFSRALAARESQLSVGGSGRCLAN